MESKLVSIIVPTHNSSKFISKTIYSILNQSYQNFELIIVDDCSTDKTFEILKKLQLKNKKIIKILKTTKNYGTGAGPRNLGIKNSNGELISFNDSDDVWEKNKLKKQMLNYSNKKYIYFCAAKYFINNEKTNFFVNNFRIFLQKFIIKKINKEGFHWFYIYNPVLTSSVLVHKDAFKNNFFDEHIHAREDIDMWVRLRQQNYKLFLNTQTLINIKKRNNSSSSNSRKELVTIVRSLSNIFFKINNFSYLNYFLTGILIKFFLFFVKINYKTMLTTLKKSIAIISIIYFIVFYSPLFWHIGKPLLHHDKFTQNELKSIKNIIVFSGHGKKSYFDITSEHRYNDVLDILKNSERIENIFLIGKLQEIPTQNIIKKLLILEGVEEGVVKLIYQDFDSSVDSLTNIKSNFIDNNIKDAIFSTSPYHSKRASLLWSKHTNINLKFWKSNVQPVKNSFFKYSKNKKLIIYEYCSIMYYKLIGKF